MTEQNKQMKIYLTEQRKTALDKIAQSRELSTNQLVNLILNNWFEKAIEAHVLQEYKAGNLIIKGNDNG